MKEGLKAFIRAFSYPSLTRLSCELRLIFPCRAGGEKRRGGHSLVDLGSASRSYNCHSAEFNDFKTAFKWV